MDSLFITTDLCLTKLWNGFLKRLEVFRRRSIDFDVTVITFTCIYMLRAELDFDESDGRIDVNVKIVNGCNYYDRDILVDCNKH